MGEMESEKASVCSRKECESTKQQHVVKLLSELSVSGLNRVATASNFGMKLFWIILFVCGFIGFTINLIAITHRFARVPILTQTKYDYNQFTWPDITICNPTNPIAFGSIPNSKLKWKNLFEKAKRYSTSIKVVYDEETTKFYPHYLAMSSIRPSDFLASPSSLVHKMKITVHQNRIAASSGDHDRLVLVDNITNLFYHRLGSARYPLLCHTLRVERLLDQFDQIRHPTYIKSIQLLLLMDKASYDYFNLAYEKRKLSVYIGHPNTTLKSSDFFPIYSGTKSHFIIKDNYRERIVKCVDHLFHVQVYDSLLQSTNEYFGGYEDCHLHFLQSLFLKKCKCHNPFIPIYNLTVEAPRLCLNMSLFTFDQIQANVQCINNLIIQTRLNVTNYEFKKNLSQKCSKYLIPKCKQRIYSFVRTTDPTTEDINESRKNLLSEALVNFPIPVPKNAKPNEFLLNNTATVKLIQKSRNVVGAIEEHGYSTASFLSDIGGILGLWLGLGVINVFEIFELLGVLVRHKHEKKRKHQL